MNFEKTNPGFNNFMKTLKATGFSPNLDEAKARTDEMQGAKDSLNPSPSSSPHQSMQPQMVKLRDGRVIEMFSPTSEHVHREEVHHEIMPPQKEEIIHVNPIQPKLEPIEIKPIMQEELKAEEPKPQTFEKDFVKALKSTDPDDDFEKPLIDDDFKKLFGQ